MEKYFEDLLDNFQELHNEVENVLKSLPSEALDWSPGEEMNSLAVLIAHLTGSQRFWIGDVALAQPSDRNREAEFRVRNLDKTALHQRLDGIQAYIRAAFDSLELSDLEKSRWTNKDGKPVTVGWAIAHALEHTAIHVGHIQLMRQLWEQKA